MIRHGHEGSAVLTVTLRNRGADAFRANDYGDSIMVRRTIRPDGGTNYRLMSRRGKMVKPAAGRSVKQELEALLDRFNIDVGNPVSVLDQENSKKFLHGQGPEKYKFFMKATQLQKIEGDMGWIGDQLATAKMYSDANKMFLPQLKAQMEARLSTSLSVYYHFGAMD